MKRTWWFAWLTAAALASTQVKDVAEGLEKIMALAEGRPDALAIAEQSERGAFTRELTEAAWKRLFWARAVIGRTQSGWSKEQIDEAYKGYIAASEAWHTKLMTFISLTERHYGAVKAKQLEIQIVGAMNDLAEQVAIVKVTPTLTPEDFRKAQAAIDSANDALFYFVRGFRVVK